MKNKISNNDLIAILSKWKGGYRINRNHGNITMMELTREYTMFPTYYDNQIFMENVVKLYPHHINFELDNEKHIMVMTVRVSRDAINDFYEFIDNLSSYEEKAEKLAKGSSIC